MSHQQSMMQEMMQQRMVGGCGGGSSAFGSGPGAGGLPRMPNGMMMPGMLGNLPGLHGAGMPGGMPSFGMPGIRGGMSGGMHGGPGGVGTSGHSFGSGGPGSLPQHGSSMSEGLANGMHGGCGFLSARPGTNGGRDSARPSMEDLAKNSSSHCSGQTISDQDVKVQDPSGRVMAEYPRYRTFDAAPFPPVIQDALKKAGFPAPSQIQQYCWPLAMQSRDVIGVAATGSGKTISFLLPAFAACLERKVSAGDPFLLVLAPTRELAVQIQEEADKFAKPMFKTVCCYGGAPKGPQAAELRSGVHGVIGTPGRVNDFLEGNQLELGSVAKLVLDEADRMLDMGFEPQIRKILQKIPSQRQSMFFTATWPPSVRRLAGEFLRGAYTVTIGNRDELKGNQDITQIILTCRSNEKNSYLMQTLRQAGVADRNNGNAKGLVFCSTKRMCDQLAQSLERGSIPCAAIHGDKGQREREVALQGLKDGKIKLLVATDVAARGLDIKGVTLVINYDLPSNTEDYVHRIGRTGRAGQKGHAVALVSERDTHALRGIIQVMQRTNQSITPEIQELARHAPPPPPSGRAARGGPPPVQIDPNFKPGLNSGGASPSAPSAEGGPVACGLGDISNGGGMGGDPAGGRPPMGGGGGGDFGGSRSFVDRGGNDRFGGGDRFGGERFGGDRGGRGRGMGDSPGRRRRSPSRRRRSQSRRRRSPSRRRRSPSQRRQRERSESGNKRRRSRSRGDKDDHKKSRKKRKQSSSSSSSSSSS